MFSILVAAGFYYRRQSEIHKRLMLVATITILAPAIARLPFVMSSAWQERWLESECRVLATSTSNPKRDVSEDSTAAVAQSLAAILEVTREAGLVLLDR